MKNPITHLNEQIDIYDIFILGLTGLSILTIVVLAIPTFDSTAKQIALTLELIISFLFMIDFFISW